jgi:CheY-like chemotaxis protein
MGTVIRGGAYPTVQAEPKTVLVAEDERLIRLMAVDVLTEAGFDVVEAGHAKEALTALEAGPWTIHLLLTDIQMPDDMNGLQLAHHVHVTWPHIGLIITSGEQAPSAANRPHGSVFVAKPYNPNHVVAHAQVLTSALHKAASGRLAP